MASNLARYPSKWVVKSFSSLASMEGDRNVNIFAENISEAIFSATVKLVTAIPFSSRDRRCYQATIIVLLKQI